MGVIDKQSTIYLRVKMKDEMQVESNRDDIWDRIRTKSWK